MRPLLHLSVTSSYILLNTTDFVYLSCFFIWCFMKVWLLRILGFIIGTALAFAFEFALLLIINEVFEVRLLPRGIGWVAIPIFIGISAAKLAPRIERFPKFNEFKFNELSLNKLFWESSKITRIVFVAPIFWICSVILYVFLFEPYGGYMSDRDYLHMFKVMSFPSIILIAGRVVYSKFISSHKAS